MRHVALLRGIGPGNPKMRNGELVRVLEGVGLRDVEAVISSGNYVFSTDEGDRSTLEDLIEAGLEVHLGAPCSTIVRSRNQIEGLCRLDVFAGRGDGPDARCHVTFLKRRPPAGHALPSGGDGYEVLSLQRQAVFLVVDGTRSKTPDVMAQMERAFGKEITTRTWRTVQRIRRALEG
jgi:uncharacterized protein (DUF1697 family)